MLERPPFPTVPSLEPDSANEPMRLEEFDFELPRQLVAERPASPRDTARLLRVGAGLADSRVRDLPDLLRPGDLMVFNDTAVIPARLFGRREQGAGDGARVEVTLIAESGRHGQWRALAKPVKRLKPGERILFAPDFSARFLGRAEQERGAVLLDFELGVEALLAKLELHGAMPLPPYIKRPADAADRRDYQTVYARDPGAIAAPTAGLHFTEALLAALDRRGIERVAVTLHVGPGTFLPVEDEDPSAHRMHGEKGIVTDAAARAVNRAKAEGRRVIAVGTTAVRLLESAAGDDGRLRPFAEETRLFILPGYRFKAIDLLFTNFHLPKSTLFMLVSAFGGIERIKAAYAYAVREGYRFFSYGDACLIEPEARS